MNKDKAFDFNSIQPVKVLDFGVTQHAFCLFRLNDGNILIGFYEGILQIVEPVNYKKSFSMNNFYFNKVIQLDNGNWVFSYHSLRICSYKAHQIQEEFSIPEERYEISKLSKNRFINYSYDTEIKVWKGDAPTARSLLK